MMQYYKLVLESPENYLKDKVFGKLATKMLEDINSPKDTIIPLNPNPIAYEIFGSEQIEEGALKQMETAMKLPITVAGALMPDAHQGYGLPIGGVLATKNHSIRSRGGYRL